MSRIRFLGATLIAFAAAGGSAMAADVSVGYEAPPAPAYNETSGFSWNGAYAGLQGGYQWSGVDDENDPFSANGLMGGVYGGYNFEVGQGFVLGLEGDANVKSASGSNDDTWYSNPWDASLRLRAGVAFDRFLAYGTGGVAVGKVNVRDDNFKDSSTNLGWVAGLGIEAAMTDNVVGRAEFRHTDLGSESYALTTPTEVSSSSNALLLGIGVKF
jgi:outer membrane immunogenic protein